MFFLRLTEHKFVDRGDPSSYDFTTNDFTKDETYRELDLSGIISSGTKLVLLTVSIQVTASNGFICLRKNGNSNELNNAFIRPGVINCVVQNDIHIAVDADGKCQYKCSTGLITSLNVIVRGWFV